MTANVPGAPRASLIVERQGCLFTLKPYPKNAPNPSKFRWAIYRDGGFVGAAHTKKDAEDRISSGYYDPKLGG